MSRDIEGDKANEILDRIQEQFDRGAYQQTFDVSGTNRKTFEQMIMPFAVGYLGGTHGITDIGYMDRTITVTKQAEEPEETATFTKVVSADQTAEEEA